MHLFIVNERTLPVHLEYGFVGTGRREGKGDCSWDHVTIGSSGDRVQAGLYADICRVHRGDEILFYLEKPRNDLGREGGRFFGVFEAIDDAPLYERAGAYLHDELGMPLIYRLRIRPMTVFRTGLTEWQAMDEMTDFRTVHDIPWTIIYRKMEGGRSCTPLLPHEAAGVRRMLDLRNAGQHLPPTGVGFDPQQVCLAAGASQTPYRGPAAPAVGIQEYLRHLMTNTDRQWEVFLQAYLLQSIKRDPNLTRELFPEVDVTWIGNEVYAGAGMQSIDILVFPRSSQNTFIHLIELKSGSVTPDTAAQLNRYIKWLRSHIPDASVHQIIPTVVAQGVSDLFHESMRVYLAGHGICQYRVVLVDSGLNLKTETFSAF